MMQTFANVWDALIDDPGEAAVMTARSRLMIAVTEAVESWNSSPVAAARRLGITQPRLNDLLKGRIDKFSLDTLLILAGKAGLKVEIKIAA
jgi:predicted XRE-type DNA-binding protein